MDVDELTGLAKQVDAAAQKLYNLVSMLSGALGELVLLWHGPLAATFEQDWQSKNRPALLAAYSQLSALHQHLTDNISQQVSASAVESGWTAAVGAAEDVLKGAGLIGIPAGLIAGAGAPAEELGQDAGKLKKGWSY